LVRSLAESNQKTLKVGIRSQGRRQKIFRGGGGGTTEKIPKISKKYRKIALFNLFQVGATGKKAEK